MQRGLIGPQKEMSRQDEASKKHTVGMDFESLMTPMRPTQSGPKMHTNGSSRGVAGAA